ncbi:hypothetical protein NQ318_015764 [Aromia moschata]|uniref:Heparanase n=1 Tax=Aromia moschata TaxID=1265417 RepID=A0AAV8XMS3_9CUCU|nr:hypothetical protein NQ318_015764 [Aromia moschata]
MLGMYGRDPRALIIIVEKGTDPSRTVLKKIKFCNVMWSTLAAIFVPLLIVLFIITFAISSVDKIQIIYIDRWKPAPFITSTKFLSISLDSSVIANGFKDFNMTDPKLIKMIGHLSPAFLRVGGTLGDKLCFAPDLIESDKNVENFYERLNEYEDLRFAPNFTMTGTQWLKLTNLAEKAKLDIFFGLNALRRFPNGTWDYRNAESLISFSSEHKLNVNWELGNEPNIFYHKFNKEVSPTQMAKDFATLRSILKKYQIHNQSLLVGPDTTRPIESNNKSTVYLRRFLKGAIHVVDAVTWHQYYMNGRTAKPEDFLNPGIFDYLKIQIQAVKNITKDLHASSKPLWLGETSSAYGGGAPNLSDTFIGSFIWADKLGLSAKMGLEVVVRQSIVKGHYALLDNNYNPNPDWWLSVLHKKFIGIRVVPYYTSCSPAVRLYCHCSKKNIFVGSPSITVFGVNLDNSTANVRIEGLFPDKYEDRTDKIFLTSIYAFELTSDSLFSKTVYLNGKPLKLSKDYDLPKLVPKIVNSRPYVTMPPLSIVFWIIPSSSVEACLELNHL